MTMHNYATNSPIRHKLIFLIAFIAVVCAGALGVALSWANQAWGLQFSSLSSMAIFGILFFVFDKWLWRFSFLRSVLLVPDLNGTWACVGRTLIKGGEDVDLKWEAEVVIIQSWSRILVTLKAKDSTSQSVAASLYSCPGAGFRLIYHYDNSPYAERRELQRHFGLCDLMFDEVVATAQGQYFTDRDRQTVGAMTLKLRK